MRECPAQNAFAQIIVLSFEVGEGPFMLVGARSFGRIAAMRLTAARSSN